MHWFVGYVWGLENYFDLGLKLDVINATGGSDDGLIQGSFSGSYLLNDAVHAPYVVGQLGYGTAKIDAKNISETSWIIAVGAGMKFFRASTVNAGIEAQLGYFLEEINKENPSYLSIMIKVFY